MKGMARLWSSLASSLDVWPASDPEPGLGRKAEGGQHWVGYTTLASLMGGSYHHGMSVCRMLFLMPASRDFKSTAGDSCERVATLFTSAHSGPLSLTMDSSSSHLPSEVKPTEHKVQWVSSAWSGLMLVLFVPTFPASQKELTHNPQCPALLPLRI